MKMKWARYKQIKLKKKHGIYKSNTAYIQDFTGKKREKSVRGKWPGQLQLDIVSKSNSIRCNSTVVCAFACVFVYVDAIQYVC